MSTLAVGRALKDAREKLYKVLFSVYPPKSFQVHIRDRGGCQCAREEGEPIHTGWGLSPVLLEDQRCPSMLGDGAFVHDACKDCPAHTLAGKAGGRWMGWVHHREHQAMHCVTRPLRGGVSGCPAACLEVPQMSRVSLDKEPLVQLQWRHRAWALSQEAKSPVGALHRHSGGLPTAAAHTGSGTASLSPVRYPPWHVTGIHIPV